MRQLLIILLSLIITTRSAAQVSHIWQQVPLSDVIRTINNESKDYHIHCIYDQLDSLLITAKVSNMSVPAAIKKVTNGQPVKVKTKGNDIFIQYQKRAARRKMFLASAVLDSRTHTIINNSTVQLLTADSILIDQRIVGETFTINDRTYTSGRFYFEVPRIAANYIFRVSHIGYETAYVNVSLSKISRWEFQRDLPPIYLKEKRHMLKEVNVVASKVMFYYRGDTIVYNADAFQLAEGSMLDALVKQLPGVELKDGGRIYHNGKFVQNLLLNGKDFFRGRQDLLLENLPSYTVKEIKVYDKYGRQSELLGEQLDFDKEYVMDVQLKREYNIGWLANVEVGAGTNDRYLARLFALRHSDHSQIAIISNMNNLNDDEKPGETKTWNASLQITKGRRSQKMAGVDYKINERDGRWNLNGDTKLTYSDYDETNRTERTNYLLTGDTYDHSQSYNRNKTLNLESFNSFLMRGFSLWQTFTYNKTDLQSGSSSLTLSSADSLLNEQIRQGMTHSHSLTTNTDISYIFAKKVLQGSSIAASLTHTDKDDDRFNRYNIRYGMTKDNDLGDHYTKGHPDRMTKARVQLTYLYRPSTKTNFRNRYNFIYDNHRQRSALYLLNRIDSLQQLPFGTLPSTLDYERTMDLGNSYDSHRRDICHALDTYFHHTADNSKGHLDLSIQAYFNILNQHLDYQRGTTDTTIVRKPLLLEYLICGIKWYSSDKMHYASFNYSLSGSTPDLVNFVNIRDTTDPMNMQEGNNGLKNTYTHSATLSYNYNNKEEQTTYWADLTYNYIQNTLSKGYHYDSTTGIRIWKPYNVNGNWNMELRSNYERPLDRQKRLTLRAYTSLDYQTSVDMINDQRSQVNTFKVRQYFRLNWKLGQHTLGLVLDGNYRNTRSPRTDFDKLSAFYFSNGMTALLKLPWKMELSTDFFTFTRTRYNDPSMNGTEWVWNARLTRPFLNGRLLCVIDGYDLLAQRSNITRVIDAQGRTETYTNSLPRYILCHFIYRFNKLPKNNNKVVK